MLKWQFKAENVTAAGEFVEGMEKMVSRHCTLLLREMF